VSVYHKLIRGRSGTPRALHILEPNSAAGAQFSFHTSVASSAKRCLAEALQGFKSTEWS